LRSARGAAVDEPELSVVVLLVVDESVGAVEFIDESVLGVAAVLAGVLMLEPVAAGADDVSLLVDCAQAAPKAATMAALAAVTINFF